MNMGAHWGRRVGARMGRRGSVRQAHGLLSVLTVTTCCEIRGMFNSTLLLR